MSTAASSIPLEQQTSEAPAVEEITGSQENIDHTSPEGVKQKEKRRLFGLLKKKDSSKTKSSEALSPDLKTTDTATGMSPSATTPAKAIPRSVTPTPLPNSQYFPASPQSRISAASPSRYMRSSSPALNSPSSSSIFERNVQEQPLPDDLQSAIPHHIQTEDHIPPTLEASSLVITDEQLNPDEVEIVMSSLHQPASAAVVHQESAIGSLSPLSLSSEMPQASLSPSAFSDSAPEEASHYGSLDSADVRRLSFISFADVVQGEHALDNPNKDLHMSMMSTSTTNRSPSPIRSPASSHGAGEFGMSPPTSGAPSVKGVDIGKAAYSGGPLSVGTQSPPLVGSELTVETMRQALRKTGSGDLSHARSPVSPIERSHVFLPGPSEDK